MLARNLLSAIFRVNKGKHKTANIYDIKRGFSKRTVHHIKSLLGTNNGASCHQQRCLLPPTTVPLATNNCASCSHFSRIAPPLSSPFASACQRDCLSDSLHWRHPASFPEPSTSVPLPPFSAAILSPFSRQTEPENSISCLHSWALLPFALILAVYCRVLPAPEPQLQPQPQP